MHSCSRTRGNLRSTVRWFASSTANWSGRGPRAGAYEVSTSSGTLTTAFPMSPEDGRGQGERLLRESEHDRVSICRRRTDRGATDDPRLHEQHSQQSRRGAGGDLERRLRRAYGVGPAQMREAPPRDCCREQPRDRADKDVAESVRGNRGERKYADRQPVVHSNRLLRNCRAALWSVALQSRARVPPRSGPLFVGEVRHTGGDLV
jgi:hypothetical protein